MFEPIWGLALLLLANLIGWSAWIIWDAKDAFDGDPYTHSASERMKHWRRTKGKKGYVYLGIPIASLAVLALFVAIYLAGHLLLELY